MDTAGVELDPLSDPVGAGAEDDDFFPRGGLGLVLRFVGGVEIRRTGLELRGAGINALVDRTDFQSVASLPHRSLAAAGQLRDLTVGETFAFPATPGGCIGSNRRCRDLALDLDQVPDVVNEPGIDRGELTDLIDRHSVAKRIADRKDALRRWRAKQIRDLLEGRIL